MSPFMGHPIGFTPATLALLDAALTDLYADFKRAKVTFPTTAPVVSEIDVPRTDPRTAPPRVVTSIVVSKRSPRKAAGGLRFDKARGWHLR